MAKISFNTSPRKVFYSYLGDGHIYDISTTLPQTVADGGGYWYCYFICTPFVGVDGKFYPLFTKTTDNKYIRVSTDTIHKKNNTYYYTTDYKSYTSVKLENYYSENGTAQFNIPNDASELPQVTKDDITYYFDTLITNGGTYEKSKFSPIDVKKGEDETTTFGDLIKELIEKTVNIGNFVDDIKNLPTYLQDSISSIGYTVKEDEYILYGTLFIKMLNEAMKKEGEKILALYANTENTSKYKKVTIETKIDDKNVGTITNTPSE